jgi:hypothetical protein
MHGVPENGWRGSAAALLRSYTSDLRGWAGRLARGYAVAVALLVGGVLALFASIAVGITALVDFLQRTYGIESAYGSIGGGLLALAIVLFLIGWMMLRRKARRRGRGRIARRKPRSRRWPGLLRGVPSEADWERRPCRPIRQRGCSSEPRRRYWRDGLWPPVFDPPGARARCAGEPAACPPQE